MSELRDRMVRDMTVRGLSPRTHTAYLRAWAKGEKIMNSLAVDDEI